MNYSPIQLQRKVTVQCIEVSATISRPESREDLLIALRFGKEMLENGSEFSPSTIVTHLLHDFPINAGQRILRRLEDLKLVVRVNSRGSLFPKEDTEYELTQKGEEALESERIFMPEYHAMEIRYVEDVLFPQRVIGIQLIKESLRDVMMEEEGDEESQQWQERKKDFISVPETLQKIQGCEISILEGNESYLGPIIFEKIDEKVRLLTTEQQVLFTLVIDIESGAELTLQVGQHTHPLKTPNIQYNEIFFSLLKQKGLSWNKIAAAVECCYDELDVDAKRDFKRDFIIQTPQFIELGVFDETVLGGVSIIPKTQEDAEAWADFLVKEEIRDYTTENKYKKIIVEVRNKFPLWEGLHILSIEELIQEEKKAMDQDGIHSSRYWYLQAPRDLQV